MIMSFIFRIFKYKKEVFILKKNKCINILSYSFNSYKLSWTMFLLGLSGVLYLLGNKFGMIYLVLAFLPVLAWVILLINERNSTHL